MYTPSTCAGCTAEIEAIYHDKVQAFVYATSPYNLPVEKKYKLSDNVLNSKNPKVWKSILESKYLNELQERVDYFIKELAPLPEAEDLLNKLSDFKKDIGEAIEGAIDAYNELHPKDIDSLTDSLEKITTKTVAACGSKQKRSVDPCKNVKPLYQPLPDNEHIINQYLDYAFIVATKQGRNLKYMTNLSKLLDETKENYSKVEQRKLDLLLRKASNFRKKYIDDNSLKAISKKDFPKQLPALYSNGEHTILLFKENNQYKLYSKSINYNEIFTLKADLTYPELSSFIEQFFSVNSINLHYNCYVLTKPLPENAINQLKLKPHQISTDYQELLKGKVPGIKNFSEKEILDLSGYNFQNKDIKKLTKINLNKVKTLILDNNNIGINGLEAILYSGNFPNLKELSIRNNKLDIKDASSLINLNKLPILDISQNKFSLQAIEQFSLLENSKIQIVTGKDYDQLKYQIGQYGGYDKYLESVHIQEIMPNMHSKQYGKALGNKLLNAAGHIQLINSLHSISQTCVQDDATKECMLGLAGFSYSFLSQPIENIAIKYTVKSLNNAGNIASKFSRFKSIKPEFIIKVGAGKYAVKFAKGAAGAIAGVFDIVDITLASVKLNECLSTIDNKCSDKEIRDSIASITFSSISFISGIVFIANPIAGIVVGTVLMIGQGIYNGVSNIIEYEEKYDTTHNENWSIFWRSFLSYPMHKDITELAARKEYIDKLTEQAFANFRALSNNTDIVAYGFGLGEIFLETVKVKKTVTPGPLVKPNLISKNYREVEVEETNTKLCSSSSVIDMSKPHNKKYSLSRFLPKKLPQTDIICLPKKTNNNYEYSEESNNSEDSKYYCENAVVIQSQANSFSKNPSIIYDLGYINSGYIIGSNKWNNIFYIHESNSALRGGENITNHFVFLGKNFTGRIKFAYNSTNIIDTSKLSNEDIKISWNSTVPISGLMNIRFANEKSTIWAEQIDEKIKINIYGSRNNTDTVICNTEDVASKSKLQSPILVNTGGANNPFYPDKIKNCNDVVVYPNTNVSGEVGKYLFYIKTNGFGNYNTKSEIDVKGNVTVTFPDIVLL
ncbi:leucine-rich repeat domain-containing protein [Rickettsia endosymbiont of Lasioglossum villosulum]|uniref:leucine-rich repeat domain-containing protein n=1 Tax=Rickettsia endosymbiont of Lasioglossum villosulum TaxID=3066269 RepID=UPI003132E9A2